MINIKNVLFLYFIIFFHCDSYAVFYDQIDYWQSEDGKHEIFCFSDFHPGCYYKKVAERQQNELITWAKQLNALVIVEDKGDEKKSQEYREYFKKFKWNFVPKDITPLRALTNICRKYGIAYVNVENRFWRSGLEYMLEAGDDYYGMSKIQYLNTLNFVHQQSIVEYEKVKKDIQTFIFTDNHSSLRDYYQTTINIIENAPGNISKCVDFTDFHMQLDFRERQNCINNIRLFDKENIDAHILHAVYQNKGHQYIFICAGGGHIENISQVLPLLGYKRMDPVIKPCGFSTLLCEESAVAIDSFFDKAKPAYRPYKFLKYGVIAILAGISAWSIYKWYAGINLVDAFAAQRIFASLTPQSYNYSPYS